jgi:hypothetical protein
MVRSTIYSAINCDISLAKPKGQGSLSNFIDNLFIDGDGERSELIGVR